MDILEMQKAKRKLQDEILRLVRQFERDTNVTIRDIQAEQCHFMGKPTETVDVRIEVVL